LSVKMGLAVIRMKGKEALKICRDKAQVLRDEGRTRPGCASTLHHRDRVLVLLIFARATRGHNVRQNFPKETMVDACLEIKEVWERGGGRKF
jgi:hypothetical protein